MKYSLMIAAAIAASCAWADKVTLKSGSYLTGEAGAMQDGQLQFKSDDLGDIKIAIANVAKLESAKTHVVQYVDNTREEKPLTIAGGAVVDGNAPLDMAKVKAIDPVAETWHGSVNVSFLAARGNTYENTASVVGNLNRRWDIDRLALDGGYYYGESGVGKANKTKSTDRWEAEVKHDHFWSGGVYSYENGRFDRDMIQSLESRYRVGLGAGYQWLDNRVFELTGKWSFNQEFGLNWLREQYEHEDSKEGGFVALRYAHHLGYIPKWAQGVEVFHNAEIIPEVDDWDKFLAKSDIGFTTKIIFNFDLLAKVEWDFNSQPCDGRKKSDLRYIVGLGYKW